MGEKLIFLKFRYLFYISCVICFLSLQLFLHGCIKKEPRSSYNFISDKQLRVLEICALVYTDPYYQYISPSRKNRLKKIRITSWGFWANFEDGRAYRVPIQSGLNLGEEYYCSFRRNREYCPSLNDSNYKCEWD